MVSRGSDSLGLEREECGRHGETREGAVFTLGLWKYRVVDHADPLRVFREPSQDWD